jgi:hypothetical protein
VSAGDLEVRLYKSDLGIHILGVRCRFHSRGVTTQWIRSLCIGDREVRNVSMLGTVE